MDDAMIAVRNRLVRIWTDANASLFLGLFFLVAGLIAIVASFVLTDTQFANVAATSGSGLATAGGIFLALGTFVQGSQNTTSQFYLDRAIENLRRARALLEDGNNDRRTWILVARIIARSHTIAEKLTVEAHREVFALEQDVHRPFFADALKTGRTGLAAFFMGSENHGETFAAAEQRQSTTFEILALSPSSLKVIFDAAEYPDKYEDALGERFTVANRSSVSIRYPSLAAYLRHVEERPPVGAVRVRRGVPEDFPN